MTKQQGPKEAHNKAATSLTLTEEKSRQQEARRERASKRYFEAKGPHQ